MEGGGGTPRPVLFTGAKKSNLGCLISFELPKGFQNFVVINKIQHLKKIKNDNNNNNNSRIEQISCALRIPLIIKLDLYLAGHALLAFTNLPSLVFFLNTSYTNWCGITATCHLTASLYYRVTSTSPVAASLFSPPFFRKGTDLYYARGAQGVLPMSVIGAASQLDLPSLTTLFVAGCARLQLRVQYWATSVDYCM